MTVKKLIEWYENELKHSKNTQRWKPHLSEYYRGRIEAIEAVIHNLQALPKDMDKVDE